MDEIPTRPYLLRALYEWCVDNGYTPHLAVKVDSRSQVPQEHVRNGEITLNISPAAVHKLQMGNEQIEFSARFAGTVRQITVPVDAVYALYARETGNGMTFEVGPAKPPARGEGEPAVRMVGKDAAGSAKNESAGPESQPGSPQREPQPPALPAPTGGPKPTKPGGRPSLRRVK